MIVNFNIGLLGHVDSGKTSIAKALSTIASTAAFDKNPQSKERGITLDLGFSAVMVEAPEQLVQQNSEIKELQLTFVDCPGHASLIRTIIGGAQIIDLMLLVIDVQKGIQTQTAECIVIGELLRKKLIVIINKVDLLPAPERDVSIKKMETKLRKVLAGTNFDKDFPVYAVSAINEDGIAKLLQGIKLQAYLPAREIEQPFLMYIDHCFLIKGQGTVCTGTIVQGSAAFGDNIELPLIKEQRKVKSMQMFRRPVQMAGSGDRVGICVTQFNAKQMERGVACRPGYLKPIYAAVIQLKQIQYYKFAIKSKSKLHISVGHDTVMANITLFSGQNNCKEFQSSLEYEYIEELSKENNNEQTPDSIIFALLQFDAPILTAPSSILIASKLDLDTNTNCCRLAFWGQIQWNATTTNYITEELPKWKIYKNKLKQGTVQRYVSKQELIVQNFFKKESKRELYVGKQIELSSGELGRIESTFGQTSKVKCTFLNELNEATVDTLKKGHSNDIKVLLKFKKYIFHKNLGIIQ